MAIEVLQSLIAARVRNYPSAMDYADIGSLAYLSVYIAFRDMAVAYLRANWA